MSHIWGLVEWTRQFDVVGEHLLISSRWALTIFTPAMAACPVKKRLMVRSTIGRAKRR